MVCKFYPQLVKYHAAYIAFNRLCTEWYGKGYKIEQVWQPTDCLNTTDRLSISGNSWKYSKWQYKSCKSKAT